MIKNVLSGGVLDIYVPTYHRPNKLKVCLNSICSEIENSYLERYITVHVSSNDSMDKITNQVMQNYDKPYIYFHKNEKNLGIDINHDLIYQYCSSKYVLLLGDDDFLLENSLQAILRFVQSKKNFLFAVCNSQYYKNGVVEKKRLFYFESDMEFRGSKGFKYFIFQKPRALLPLIPYFGGLIINREMISTLLTEQDRNKYQGTFHQYIGTIWDAYLKTEESLWILGSVSIAQGLDDDKTWFEYREDVYKNVSGLYRQLPIADNIKTDILQIFKYEGKRIRKIVIPIIRLKSKRWRL